MADAPAAMVDRVVLILNAFQRGSTSMTLSEVSDLTGLPRSSTHRIVQQLISARWLEKHEGAYRLGLGIFELGSLVSDRNRIAAAARLYMQQLSAGRYVVHLAVLDGHDVVYLDKVGGPFAGKLPSRVGGRLPAHCTGVGKAILAHLDGAQVADYVAAGLDSRTNRSITNETILQQELGAIRRTGLASDLSEAVADVECVAAPIFDARGVCAGISVCGPSGHVDPQTLGRAVRMAAAAISRRLDGERLSTLTA